MRGYCVCTNRCGCHPPFGRPTTASVKGLRSIAGHSSSLRSDEHPSMRQRNVGTVVGKIFRLRRNFPSLRPTQRRPLTVVRHQEEKEKPKLRSMKNTEIKNTPICPEKPATYRRRSRFSRADRK